MVEPIEQFLAEAQRIWAQPQAGEHSYRPALEALFNTLSPDIHALNEPRRSDVGAPDFVFLKGDIEIGHMEAKDIPVDIRKLKDANKKQQDRYREGLENLIYSNGLDWDFYEYGQRVASITIADFIMGQIQPKPENFERLWALLQDFITGRPLTIKNPDDLAARMAGKAKLIREVMREALEREENSGSDLDGQYQAFKDLLIHDISIADFADMHAETLAYGLFAARLHDPSLQNFSREEAAALLPKTNPFLKNLFGYIAGPQLDARLVRDIDGLIAVFLACDVKEMLAKNGNLAEREDPFIHFYETFLAAYNPAKRKSRGVWYTPQPVVQFIVRAVDQVLKQEFGLPQGLASHDKISVDWDTGQSDKAGKPLMETKEMHRVQILDPATGTGTFLAEAVRLIATRIQKSGQAAWKAYVGPHLIPRLHGFEIMMASYAMCHMKLDMLLGELGYEAAEDKKRLSVWLTNSLEQGEREVQDLFMARWLSAEARGANTIKRDQPIMCILGNPPYLGEGGVSEGWLGTLMDDYKKEPGGQIKLQERNPKWINDLYVKFILNSPEFAGGFLVHIAYSVNSSCFRCA